jgi:alkylhydroperoxidase family enzyme
VRPGHSARLRAGHARGDRRLRSSYCSLAHGKVLAERFDGPDVVRSIVGDPATAGLSDVDRAVLTLADKVAAGAADMTEADLGELRALGVADDAILDVVLAAAARCFFSTVIDAVGAVPDPVYREFEPQLRESLIVGRPMEEPVGPIPP